MATINPHKNKDGQITGYYVKICVGRDSRYKQIQLTKKFPRPVGLTPAKERKELQRLADAWELEKKAEYERNRQINDRDKITFAAFVYSTNRSHQEICRHWGIHGSPHQKYQNPVRH